MLLIGVIIYFLNFYNRDNSNEEYYKKAQLYFEKIGFEGCIVKVENVYSSGHSDLVHVRYKKLSNNENPTYSESITIQSDSILILGVERDVSRNFMEKGDRIFKKESSECVNYINKNKLKEVCYSTQK